jgi:hypothetical protein
MNLKEIVKESLLKIANLVFNGNLSEMSREIDIPRAQLQTYGIRSVPGGDVLRKFIDYGISSDYILTCQGSMFADNKAGQELKLKFDEKYKDGNYKIVTSDFFDLILKELKK